MRNSRKHNGFAIAIAWPETYCKQPGAWYDPITLFLGINKNHYYKVGHAALVLIKSNDSKCNYFDFGRYHSPFQYGRVRSGEFDDDLAMKTVPVISEDGTVLLNYNEILTELQNNIACHGEGVLNAAYCSVNFEKSILKVKQMQQNSHLPYGPFQYGGSNCSRFVKTAIVSGQPNWKQRFLLNYFIPFTPTPMSNVKALKHHVRLPKILKNEPFSPYKPLNARELKSALAAPVRPVNIPENAQWLSGEGAGSWFAFKREEDGIKVTRYAPSGEIECNGMFEMTKDLDHLINTKLIITYPSNCMEVSLLSDKRKIKIQRNFN